MVNTDGTSVSYTLYQSDILAGTTDEEVNASSLDIAGYKYNKDYNVDGIADTSSGVIKGDGTLVLKLYYVANEVELIYDPNGGTSKDGISESDTVVIGHTDQVVKLKNGDSLFDRAGYTFVKWNTKADGKGTDYIANSEYQLKASDNVLYAIWKANDNTGYKIEHYKVKYDADGTASVSLAEAIDAKGTTDTRVTISDKDLKDYEGYSYDASYEGTINSGIISGDGSLVLKLYYVANEVELIYDPNGGTSKDGISESDTVVIGHTDQVVKLKNGDSLFDRAGYTFVKWNTKADGKGTDYIANSEYQLKASDNVLYAIWKSKDDTKYTVNHYLVNTDGTSVSYTLYQSDILTGTTDEEVNATSLDIAGYKYNKDYNADGIADVSSGVIKGDGTLVLKLYYVNDTSNTRLVYKANGGIGADVIQVGSVNEDVIIKSGTIFKRDGYVFVGWNTKADGSGVMYHAFGSYKLKENDNVLYAIWVKMIDDYIPPVCGIDN